jgi:hypothetical protein
MISTLKVPTESPIQTTVSSLPLPEESRRTPREVQSAGLEQLSPELILVDPELGALARPMTPDPGFISSASLRPEKRLTRDLRPVSRSRPVSAIGRYAESAPVLWANALRTGPLRSRSWAFVAGIAAAAVIGLVLPDLENGRGDRSVMLAESSASDEPATARTSPTTSPGRPSRPSLQPHRFAWAPVAGAGSYHVELFDGPSKIYSADTRKPQLTVPVRWSVAGKSRSLTPGEYRWYVWPVVSGQRKTSAIVQAKLLVPSA